MNFNKVTIVLLCFALSSCVGDNLSQELQNLESRIKQHVRDDGAHLANLRAVYGLLFVNKNERFWTSFLYHDDLYIRKDIAHVTYGYKIDESSIKLEQNGLRKILYVELDEPKRIAIDRTLKNVERTYENYTPLENGVKIDVDKEMNLELERILRTYEKKNIDMTKRTTKQYFSTIAEKYGLELHLKFK